MKRIVILEPGGLHRIVGLIDGNPPEVVFPDGDINGVAVGLVKVTPRFALYKVPTGLILGKLNEHTPK